MAYRSNIFGVEPLPSFRLPPQFDRAELRAGKVFDGLWVPRLVADEFQYIRREKLTAKNRKALERRVQAEPDEYRRAVYSKMLASRPVDEDEALWYTALVSAARTRRKKAAVRKKKTIVAGAIVAAAAAATIVTAGAAAPVAASAAGTALKMTKGERAARAAAEAAEAAEVVAPRARPTPVSPMTRLFEILFYPLKVIFRRA